MNISTCMRNIHSQAYPVSVYFTLWVALGSIICNINDEFDFVRICVKMIDRHIT